MEFRRQLKWLIGYLLVPAATEGSSVKAAFLFVDLLAGYWAEEIPVTVLKTKKLLDRNVDLEQLWSN